MTDVQISTRTIDHPARLSVEVVGAGYVGLVTSACLASLGHQIRCIDVNADRIASLQRGEVPFSEPGLDALVTDNLASGRLTFSTDVVEGARGADMTLIAVGTLDGTGKWTDRHVQSVVTTLLAADDVPALLVVRSTLRPGQMRLLNELVVDSGKATTLMVHPEFTKEGTAVADFLLPDRVVVGIPKGAPEQVADPIRALYASVDAPVLVVDHASAELIKIGSNAFLATKITFANELARFCRATGADMAAVRTGLGSDSRIGPAFLKTGPGFGGSCLPSQIDLLSAMSEELGIAAEVIPAVHRFNLAQPARIVDELFADGPAPERVALLGLAFKANTDDLRESPALKIAEALRARGVTAIRAFDPVVGSLPNHPEIEVVASCAEAVEAADAIIVATEWPEFFQLDWSQFTATVAHRRIFDTRGVVSVPDAIAAGFTVHSLERGSSYPLAAALSVVGTGDADAEDVVSDNLVRMTMPGASADRGTRLTQATGD